MTLNIPLAKKDEIEIISDASIAQPNDSIVSPSYVKPSIVSKSSPI